MIDSYEYDISEGFFLLERNLHYIKYYIEEKSHNQLEIDHPNFSLNIFLQ